MKEDVIKDHRVGVLAGGSSSERDISLKSGLAVLAAIQKAGITAVFLDVNEDNFSDVIRNSGIDIAFIALHGKFGEDGTVQNLLEGMGIPYTGSGPESSRLALDKLASKEIFRENGLLVPEYRMVRPGEDLSGNSFWMPCVVKPRFEGSSIGLSVVRSREHLGRAVQKAFAYSDDVMIENFIPGREITVGVLDGRALPVIEIVSDSGIYDFDAKYTSKATRYITPAVITETEMKKAMEAGLKAHEAIGCRGFSRVDMRLADNGEFYVLEVNTIPGLTERSLLPMAARADGLDFQGLCVKMLTAALTPCGADRKGP
jgi:D-alanine-D-alanine ligase